jgi:AraC family transcriptional regulator
VSLTYSSAVAGVDKVAAPGGNWSAMAVTRSDAVQGFRQSEPRVATVIIGLLKRAQDVISIDAQTAAACIERACALVLLVAEQDCTSSAASSISASLAPGGLASLQMGAVTAHIEATLERRVRVADMARIAGLNVTLFTRAFRASFGQSPRAYIVQRRLNRAMEMMLSTREPLSQIAVACGFCDQSHFSRHFHNRFGITPHVWRHQLRGQGDPASAVVLNGR